MRLEKDQNNVVCTGVYQIRSTIFLTVEESSPPNGTSGCVILGMDCASCCSSSVSFSKFSSKVTSSSFRFFPDEKYNSHNE